MSKRSPDNPKSRTTSIPAVATTAVATRSGGSRSRPHGLNRAQGFTLVEVLVAVLVLAVGLLGLAGLQLTGMKSNDSSERRLRATIAVQDVLERMRISPADFIDVNQTIDPDTDDNAEFEEWENYVDLLGLPALSDEATIERGWVDCSSGNPCGTGNCEAGVGWDDSAGDRPRAKFEADKAEGIDVEDHRDLQNMTVRVCSRIAEDLT